MLSSACVSAPNVIRDLAKRSRSCQDAWADRQTSVLADLNSQQRALAELMSEISEDAYCAGWMDGLEYARLNAVVSDQRKYGQSQITDATIERLRELAEQCGGWIVFVEDQEEIWIPMAEWLERFKGWASQVQMPT